MSGFLASIGQAAVGAAAQQAGVPTSLAGITDMVTKVVSQNPLVAKAAAVMEPMQKLTTELPQMQEKLTTAVKDTVKEQVGQQLIQAGLPTSPESAAALMAKKTKSMLSTVKKKTKSMLSTSGANNSSGATDSNVNVDTSDTQANNNSGNSSANNSQEGGAPRYEIVTLSSPIYDPLYVCYKSGHPIYFTRSAKGVQILPNHKDIHSRFLPKQPCTQAIVKRVVSKKKKTKSPAQKKKTLRSK
jgi:hypothetical protein